MRTPCPRHARGRTASPRRRPSATSCRRRNFCAPVTCVIGPGPFGELLHPRIVGQHDGRIQMSRTTGTGLFAAIAAALILAGVAGWPVSDTQARAPGTVQIDPFTLMTGAKQLPTEHFVDYSFVF